jgi:hypothetical protein
MADDVKQDAITATLGVYSGRRNPALSLIGDTADEFANLVRLTIGKEPIHPPPPARLSGYFGFLVQTPRELAERLSIPLVLMIFQGVLTEGEGRQKKHWRDVMRVEPFLIGEAYRQGHGEALDKSGVQRPGDLVRP